MAMKLYSDVSVQNIANTIRENNGTSDTYKISEMSSAINSICEYYLDNIPTTEFDGNSNGVETITNAVSAPIKKFLMDGKSSQTGTPTVNNKINVTSINSVTFTMEDENNNSRAKTINLGDYEICSLGDGTKDILKIENNHLYIVKNTKKLQLTKNMNWSSNPSRTSVYCASFASDYGIEKLNYNMYSSHFTPSETVWELDFKFGWGATSPNTTLWISFSSATSSLSTAANFKAWLDENDCYIIAKATTPETIDLGAIENIFTYEGTNEITITTVLGTTYTLEYRQSLESAIDELEAI